MIAALLPMKSRLLILAVGALWTVPSAIAQIHESPATAGYLFAHMTSADYGHLYYSISQDGLHWSALHGGQRILNDDYLGHPEICRGIARTIVTGWSVLVLGALNDDPHA
jgi:hypothetical protein